MPFDMGFNFRSTAGYVTDPAYGVPVLGEAYPHTYTNANGNRINAGWASTPAAVFNQNSGFDARIAGGNYGDGTFTIDLSSGSAPGAGTYTIDHAMGLAGLGILQNIALIKDNTTTVVDLSNGGAGYSTASSHFTDATAVDNTGSISWAGTTTSAAFATTTAKVVMSHGTPDGTNACLAHFRLTLQAGGGGQSVVPVLMAQYRQRGA